MKPTDLTNKICGKCENWKKQNKKKGKNLYTFIDSWRDYIFFSDLIWPSLQQLFFYYVRSTSDIDECNEAHPFNAIQMHLALIPRAHTTVLLILHLLEIVLIVNFSLVFEGDEVLISFPTLNVAVNCLEFNFTRHSHRGGIILRSLVHKNKSTFDYVLNDLKTLHEL